MKWLRKLPILFLALIIAVSPLMMAVPAKADVLSGGSLYQIISVDGFDIFTDLLGSNYVCYFRGGANLGNQVVIVYSDSPLHVAFESEDSISISGSNAFLVSHLTFLPLKFPVDLRGATPYPLADDYHEDNIIGLAYYGNVAWSPSELPLPLATLSVVSDVGVLDVANGVGSWLSGAIQSASTMFWTAESGMTVLGYLAVASLALAVILLIFSLIAGWLKFH